MNPFHHTIPPLMGYRAPSTAGINGDDPFLEIGTDEGEVTFLKESLFFPKKIQLRATIEGIPLPSSSSTQVTLITQGETLQGCRLYQSDHVEPEDLFLATAFQAIQLVYTGVGTYQEDQKNIAFQGLETENFRLVLPQENVIYRKPFAWERRAAVVERVTQLDYGHVFINPPGKMDMRVLRPYGGYFRPNFSAEKAQQVYYELGEKGNQTVALLKIDIPENAVLLPAPSPEERLSLSGALAAGYGKILLQSGREKRTYKSVSSHHPGDNPFFMDVSFVACS